MSKLRRTRKFQWATIFTLVIVCLPARPSPGGKPGGGGSNPAGRICFRVAGAFYEMNDDGSGKTQVLPVEVSGRPSSGVYGGSRWWLSIHNTPDGLPELFAFREDGVEVQLTSLSSDKIRVGNAGGWINWSNDLADTFVSLEARADLNGDGTREPYVIRLPVDGDIAGMQSAGLLPLTEASVEYVLQLSSNVGEHAWSPSGNQLAYSVDNGDGTGTIVVRTLPPNPSDPPVDVAVKTVSRLSFRSWAWSHDGTRLAYATGNTSEWGGVWVMNTDGTGAIRVATNTGTLFNWLQGWSPNSSELLISTTKIAIDTSKNVYQLARLPRGGGRQTVLTADLPSNAYKDAEGNWFLLP